MKIKKIKVKNLKAISENEINLNGCTAIITAGNEKGKTTLLRGLIDRIQSEKPELILKQGEKEGFAIMELTDNSRFEWNFTEKKEILNYFTKDGFKVDVSKGSALKDIQQKFFPSLFDIDLFLSSQPKKQVEMLQKLVGLDFTQLDSDYAKYYALRTDANRDYERLKAMALKAPQKVESSDIQVLMQKKGKINAEIAEKELKIKIENKKIRENWEAENEKLRNEIENYNKKNKENEENYKYSIQIFDSLINAIANFNRISDNYLNSESIIREAEKYIENLPNKFDNKIFIKLPEPQYNNEIIDKSELNAIEIEIEKAHEINKQFAVYESELKVYNNLVEQRKAAKETALQLDLKVKEIEKARKDLIASAKFPTGFEIVYGEIKINGLPLNDKQISLSRKYIVGLQLASMELGEVKTLYFDCSTLDKNSLNSVLDWAKENDLQLLIEKPDFESGEIQYQIISE